MLFGFRRHRSRGDVVESPASHPHISGPAWRAPTAACRSAHRRWGSCSCTPWTCAACRSWSAPCGSAEHRRSTSLQSGNGGSDLRRTASSPSSPCCSRLSPCTWRWPCRCISCGSPRCTLEERRESWGAEMTLKWRWPCTEAALTSALVALLVEAPADKNTTAVVIGAEENGDRWCSRSYQTNSLQTEQKVGWGKKVALNSWHLTTWTLACLKAPRRWWRVNRLSCSATWLGAVWPTASENTHTHAK